MFGWQKEYLIMAEYPNPVICLQSIQEIALAHWTEEKLEEEVNGFIELTKQLIEKSDVVRGKAHVLYIDGINLSILVAFCTLKIFYSYCNIFNVF